MKPKAAILRNPRLKRIPNSLGFDMFELRTKSGTLTIICGMDEEGWEHVSVSPKGSKDERDQPCPTWNQMCEVKNAFWGKDEGVVQFHPPESHYLHGVGCDTNILHLWKPSDNDWSKLGWRDGE